jgi:hypothetical protein
MAAARLPNMKVAWKDTQAVTTRPPMVRPSLRMAMTVMECRNMT